MLIKSALIDTLLHQDDKGDAAGAPSAAGAAGAASAAGAAGAGGAGAPTIEQLQEELAKSNSALKEANVESMKRRKRLDELERAEQERQQAQLSESERLVKERDALKSKLETAQSETAQLKTRHAVEIAAMAANFSKPAHYVHALIAAAGLKVELGEDGSVIGIDEAIKKLQADMPELFRQPTEPAQPTPPKGKGTPPAQGSRQVGTQQQGKQPQPVKF